MGNVNSREVDRRINATFNKYVKYQVKLRNIEYIKNEVDEDTINDMALYIKYIDDFLNIFRKDEIKFIRDIYINRLTPYDMPISKSNFYYKKRKYNDILYKYLF